MKRLLSAVLLTSAILLPAASAQSVRKVAFRTLCPDHVDGIRTALIPTAKPDETQTVELYIDISPITEGVFTSGEASFYAEKTGENGQSKRVLIGKAPLGKSNRQLFVFLPGKPAGSDLPYAVYSFDDDTDTFPMGHVRAINASPVPIRFLLAGDLTPQIPPTRHAMFRHSSKVNEYNMYSVVTEFLGANNQWVKGQSVSWKAAEQRREIVITSIDLRFKRPVVRLFTDFPPWMEPASDAVP